MELHSKTGHRTAGISPTGNHQLSKSMANDLEDCDQEVIDIIIRFVAFHAYLPVASVSTRWRHAWGQRPRVSSPKWAVQSCSCLDWARACGLDIRNKPCLLAAAEGRLDVLQHAVALGYSREGMPICERAAAGGHLEVVKWCRANGYPWGLSKLLAAEGGHLEVLQWCTASNAPNVARTSLVVGRSRGPISLVPGKSETAVLNAAVKGGQLETVIWCRQQGYRWDEETCKLAVKGGHLELLKWLRDNGCPWSPYTMTEAVVTGDLEVLEWCRVNGCPWEGAVQIWAAKQGNPEIVKWSIDNDPRSNVSYGCCLGAALDGFLEVVQWQRGMGYPWGDFGLCFRVACRGHFEILKWCIANGCPWGNVPRYTSRSAFEGTVPMMEWAIENGCPWMTDPCAVNSLSWHAAVGGNLEVLKWCATNHSRSNPEAVQDVAENGHVHVLEWLRANTGFLDEYMEVDTRLCWRAALSGSLETVKWCRANGCPWDQKTCAGAARSGNLELLQWCRANGCPWGDDTCKVAINRGDFEMLAWCRDNGCPPDRRWGESSLWSGHAEMIEWRWGPFPSNSWPGLRRVLPWH